jgi:hypothetical protein
MEQRRLRLGDILDDYCPRERRVTNHVVVAMIEDDVRQTRCTTCDAEHAYKGGKAPRRRKAEAAAPAPPAPTMARPAAENGDAHLEADTSQIVTPAAPEPVSVNHVEHDVPPAQPLVSDAPPAVTEEPIVDEGPVHRPLIRATLPRPEGIKTERPAPEFTIRQNGGRGGGNYRDRFAAKGRGGHGMNGGRSGNGPRFGRGPQGRGGQGRGSGPSPGGFNRGPKKRSR